MNSIALQSPVLLALDLLELGGSRWLIQHTLETRKGRGERFMDLGAKLKKNADEFPDNTAIIFNDRVISYAELKQLSALFGNGMTSLDFVDALPWTDTGKILKKIIRAPYWKNRDVKI